MEGPKREQRPESEGKPNAPRRGVPNLWLLLGLAGIIAVMLLYRSGPQRSQISSDFLLDQINEGNVLEIVIGEQTARGEFKEIPEAPPSGDEDDTKPRTLLKHFRAPLIQDENWRARLMDAIVANDTRYDGDENNDNALLTVWLIAILLPVVLFVFLWMSFRRTRDQIMGGGFLSGFSKSPAKRFEASEQNVTFDDVAGLKGVKADLQEIVEYLKEPQKFQRLGGRVPKGALLIGPPGTGKTLLARAVAGEAGVPFYSVNGSEFIQMFVGVGASRVRDLFQNAKENSPGIIFIDEIDAVGRQRGAGLGGGHDEREQTLNQILSEMDGFSQSDSVIVVAATNRPDVLDPALLRPGRFDRHVTVGRPTQLGRKEIFQVHVRDVPLADDVDLDILASNTIGLTGADIRNIVNEAALWAARNDKNMVEMEDFEYARDKVLIGAKREEILSEKEKEKTAYHEAGHTLMAWILPGAHRVHKVTIVPRGRTLGATQTMPSEEKLSMAESEMRDHLIVLLGGRAAEELVYEETTAGAENDLEQATGMARRMVTHWGMSDRLGPVSYKMSDDDPFLGREMHQQRQFSEHTMELIDEEVAKILHNAEQRAAELLNENRDKLEKLTAELLKEEELHEKQIAELIGPSVHTTAADSNGRAASGKTEAVAETDA